MPAEAVAVRMLARVEPVPREAGQVDPADERNLVVDHDELLVVAVERPLLRVERHRDPRAAHELLARLAHLLAVRMEERQRRARPGEHAHVDALGRVREQLPQRRPSLLEPEGGVEVPAGEMDVRARRANRVGDPRQRLGAVHQQLDAAAGPWRERRRAGPASRHGVDRGTAAVPAEPPRVMGAHGALDRLADDVVDAVQRVGRHAALMPRAAGKLTRCPWSTATSTARCCTSRRR